jgi:hypothetical protein
MKLRVSFNDLPIKHGGFPNVKNPLIFLGTYYLPRGSLEQNGKARGHKEGWPMCLPTQVGLTGKATSKSGIADGH